MCLLKKQMPQLGARCTGLNWQWMMTMMGMIWADGFVTILPSVLARSARAVNVHLLHEAAGCFPYRFYPLSSTIRPPVIVKHMKSVAVFCGGSSIGLVAVPLGVTIKVNGGRTSGVSWPSGTLALGQRRVRPRLSMVTVLQATVRTSVCARS